ncbi:MAG: protein-L-isoaspartate(D-aspartate) O-methyltransferase [Calditrichaeota bacterium]|nr:MAG: protein-L-isoaspartate(D-aspartate) O-methyltransferase [Calditrichota bacterium]
MENKSKNKSQLNFENARLNMVNNQLRKRNIRDKDILHAISNIPRHMFVPEELTAQAYDDNPLPIGYGQTISQPFIVASMTQNLNVNKNHKILEIGTGCGYQTAMLAELANEVFTVEIIKSHSKSAKHILDKLQYTNIQFKVGNGGLGWLEHAPYDRIIVTAAAPQIPPQLIEQLSEGGIMVIPVGEPHALVQNLLKVHKNNGILIQTSLYAVRFVPLVDTY